MKDKMNWIKYLGFGIILGAIFEVLDLGLSTGVVGGICVILLDNICSDKNARII